MTSVHLFRGDPQDGRQGRKTEDYLRAQRLGSAGNCTSLYQNCPISIFNIPIFNRWDFIEGFRIISKEPAGCLMPLVMWRCIIKMSVNAVVLGIYRETEKAAFPDGTITWFPDVRITLVPPTIVPVSHQYALPKHVGACQRLNFIPFRARPDLCKHWM